jgi:hypothetical protein
MLKQGRDEIRTYEPPGAPPGIRASAARARRALAAAALVLAALRPAAAGDLQVDGSFVSTAPTGTPPLSVVSTTRVDGLNADLLDGLDASAFAQTPARVLWVSPSGGHFSSVQAALDAITDASASNPYLIRVGPGVFSGRVIMEPYVDIEGSGEGVTFLRAFGNATVTGASDAQIRDLTVENFGGPLGGGVGIRAAAAATSVVRVTVRVTVASGMPVGILLDGSPPSGAPFLRHVTVSASGSQASGVRSDGASYRLFDSEVTATGNAARGVMNSAGAVATLVRVQASAFSGGDDGNPVDGVWSSASEITMVDVEAKSVGGSSGYGVRILDGSGKVKLTRVRATATAADHTYGVFSLETDLEVVESELVASGAAVANWAVYLKRSGARIFCTTITASGTAATTALTASEADPGGTGSPGPWAVQVHGSQLWGQNTLVSSDSKFDTRIGASWLGGGGNVLNDGTLVCAGVYDDAFTFYFDSCP